MTLESHQASFEEFYRDHPLMRAILNNDFDEHGLAYRDPLHREFWWRKFDNIYAQLKPRNSDRLLNIGIGYGFDEKVLRKRLPDIELYGIDISQSMIRGSLLNKSPAKIAVAASEALPLPDHAFTRVLSREVIEHVLDTQAYLRQIKAVTTKGAIIVITTPNGDSLGLPHLLHRFGLESLFITSRVFRDDHMSLARMEREFADSGLVVTERFFDSAGFLWLHEVARSPLGFLAVPLSKLMRGLDGSGWLSRLFCDQVKYALVNPDGPETPVEDVSWVDPATKQPLVMHEDSISTEAGDVSYPLLDGQAPLFVQSDEEQATNVLTPEQIKRREALRPYRRAAYATALLVYTIFVMPVVLSLGVAAAIMNMFGRKYDPA